VFLLTEDITLPMILIDSWTLLMVVITVVQLAAVIVFWRVRKPSDDKKEQGATA
jgi:membrane protein implicated in regulation of membrane protease activity